MFRWKHDLLGKLYKRQILGELRALGGEYPDHYSKLKALNKYLNERPRKIYYILDLKEHLVKGKSSLPLGFGYIL